MKTQTAFLVLAMGILTASAAVAQELFVDSGQRLGNSATWDVATGDLDADGDIDVVTADIDTGATIWLNDGAGTFTDFGQKLGVCATVDIADLDSDGALDIVTGMWGQPLTVWWNDGSCGFSDAVTTHVGSDSLCFAVGDLDGDTDLDIYLGRADYDMVIMNDGNRVLRSTSRRYGSQETGGAVILDIDGDGDNDVVAAGWDGPGHVWANDGSGELSAFCEISTTLLHVHDAAYGDYDGDGDMDIFFVLAGGICCGNIWVNDGAGTLTCVAQDFGAAPMQRMTAADVNADGWIDLILGGWRESPTACWLGGTNGFTDSGFRIAGEGMSGGVALADFDSDGDLDLFIGYHIFELGSWNYLPHPNEVWMNAATQ
ncbi:VCBS repeat-containing protein [Candidatus Bipolaricaulota bacterium]|nr:VCBS repeat-containing protein [Candidatus Bipolaricaulota bacterium]